MIRGLLVACCLSAVVGVAVVAASGYVHLVDAKRTTSTIIVPPALPVIEPSGLAFLPDGKLLVLDGTDPGPVQTLVLDLTGQPLGPWPRPSQGAVWRPLSAATDLMAGKVFVAWGDHPIAVFDGTGKWMGWWRGPVRGPTVRPTQIAAAPDGSVFAEQGELVHWWAPDGSYRGSWNGPGPDHVSFTELVVDSEGRVLLDQSSGRGSEIIRHTFRGSRLDTLRLPWPGGLGPRVSTEWVGVDGWAADFTRNELVVLDIAAQRDVGTAYLGRYSNEGSPVRTVPLWRYDVTGHPVPVAVSVDSASNTAVAWAPHSRVGSHAAAGGVTVFRPDGTIRSITRMDSTMAAETPAWERLRIALADEALVLFPHLGVFQPLELPGAVVLVPPFGVDIAGLGDGRVVVRGWDGTAGEVSLLDDDGLVWRRPCGCPLATGLGADADRILITNPIKRQVLALRTADGAPVAKATLDSAPVDVASAADGRAVVALGGGAIVVLHGPGLAEEARWVTAGRVPILAVSANTDTVAVLRTDGTVEMRTLDGELIDEWLPDALPTDVLIDRRNVVHVTDAASRSVLHHEPDRRRSVRPGRREPGPCAVSANKTVFPPEIWLGEAVTVTLEVAAVCPPKAERADVVIVWDPRWSWWYDYHWWRIRESVIDLLFALVPSGARVAVLGGPAENSWIAGFDTSLDDSVQAVKSSVRYDFSRRMDVVNEISLDRLVAAANEYLADRASDNAMPAMVLVGSYDWAAIEDSPAAQAFRSRGGHILAMRVPYARGTGMREGPADLMHVAHATDVVRSVDRLVERLRVDGIRDLELVDRLSSGVTLVPGSTVPSAGVEDGEVVWRNGSVDSSGTTFTLRVRPEQTGRVPTNEFAELHFTDQDATRRTVTFPIPAVQVRVPPPTKTPRQPAPSAVFLPLMLFGQSCLRAQNNAVALVLDTSMSMQELTTDGRTKLRAAVDGARAFVELLSFPEDQVAVIGFDHDVAVHQLTSDPVALQESLASLTAEPGTDIAAGVDAATAELVSPRRKRTTTPAMLVLTDGGATDGPEPALRAASRAKARAILVFTIGLGVKVDRDELRGMASRPDWYYQAPNAGSLAAIYSAIAAELPCGRRLNGHVGPSALSSWPGGRTPVLGLAAPPGPQRMPRP